MAAREETHAEAHQVEEDDDIELEEKELLAYLSMKKAGSEPTGTLVMDGDGLEAAARKVWASLEDLPWLETLSIAGTRPLVSRHDDDLEREVSFYKGAAESAAAGQARLEAGGVPFWRPEDYFAEMVKSDKHMEKIKTKLLKQKEALEAKEAARLKKEQDMFGKKLQNIREQEKKRRAKMHLTAVDAWRRNHAPGESFDPDTAFSGIHEAARLPGPKGMRGRGGKGGRGGRGGGRGGKGGRGEQRPGKRRRIEKLQTRK